MACTQALASPRISFSQNFAAADHKTQSIHGSGICAEDDDNTDDDGSDFEFIVLKNGSITNKHNMASADELFFQGRMLCLDQLHMISLDEDQRPKEKQESKHMNWVNPIYVDEDPSPRPPRCIGGRWKELLRLKKQQASQTFPSRHIPAPCRAGERASNAVSRKDEVSMHLSRKKLQVRLKRESLSSTNLDRSSTDESLLFSKMEKLQRKEQCSKSFRTFSGVQVLRSFGMRAGSVLNYAQMHSTSAFHSLHAEKQNPKPARFTSTMIREVNVVPSDGQKR